MDARDRALFDQIYTGTPVQVTGRNRRFDLTDDNVIDEADLQSFLTTFATNRYGAVVDDRDLDALLASWTGPGGGVAPSVLALHDLDGDGDVDCDDRSIFMALATEPVGADLTGDTVLDIFDVLLFLEWLSTGRPEADWDGNGLVDIFDLIAFVQEFSEAC